MQTQFEALGVVRREGEFAQTCGQQVRSGPSFGSLFPRTQAKPTVEAGVHNYITYNPPPQQPSQPISPITHTTVAMFRSSIVRSARAVAQASARSYSTPAFRRAVPTPFAAAWTPAPVSRITAVRCYAAGSGLNQEEVTGRILDLLKNFDKVRME